jgi:hypothetical protein
MNEPNHTTTHAPPVLGGRTIGVVQVRVAGQLYALPVEAMDFASTTHDASQPRGGFFVQGDTMGILVDQAATEQQMRSQVMEGCAEAVKHLSARFLN